MIGNIELLNKRKTAFLASRLITPEKMMAVHNWAVSVRETDCTIISGFQSELEKDVLNFLLRGKCSIVIVRANRCPKNMPKELKTASEAGRILIISTPNATNKRFGVNMAKMRNRYVLDLADDYVIGSLDPNGNLAELVATLPEDKTQML